MKKIVPIVLLGVLLIAYYLTGPRQEKKLIGNWRMRVYEGGVDTIFFVEMKSKGNFRMTIDAANAGGDKVVVWIEGKWRIFANRFSAEFVSSNAPIAAFGKSAIGGRIKQLDQTDFVYAGRDGDEKWVRDPAG